MKPINLKSRTFKVAVVLLVCCLIFIPYFFYTRPVSVEDVTGGAPLVSVSITWLEITPSQSDAPAEDEFKSVFTKDSSEVESVVRFFDQYSINRKVDWKSWIGLQNSYKMDNDSLVFLSVRFSYQKPDGALDMVTYECGSPGNMSIDYVPCGVGRFGTQGNLAFYEELSQLFSEKAKSPLWEFKQKS